MRVLSLYDGMSCGMIAFRQLEYPVDEYHAFEIDKYVVKVKKTGRRNLYTAWFFLIQWVDCRSYHASDFTGKARQKKAMCS